MEKMRSQMLDLSHSAISRRRPTIGLGGGGSRLGCLLLTLVGCQTYRVVPHDGGDAPSPDATAARDADASEATPSTTFDGSSDVGTSSDVAGDLASDAAGDSVLPPDLSRIAAPRLIAPISTATVRSRRPRLRWTLANGTDGAHVQICLDRACTLPVASFDASGTSGAVTTDLSPGVLFWRAWGRSGGYTGTSPTPSWQFNVGPRSAPVDTSWGTTLDVNGDGYADLLVGGDQASRAYLYIGGRSGISATQQPLTLVGPGSSAFGESVASAGDVNGDGYGDIIIGASRAFSSAGAAYIYLGSAVGISPGQEPITLTGPDGGSSGFGASVASVGDINGDGYSDILVGAPGFGSPIPPFTTGRAHLYLGGAGGPSSANPITLDAPDGQNSTFGASVAGAGDLNGDGYADIVVGGSGVASYTGRAYVYLGSASGVSAATPTVSLVGPDGINGKFGGSVANAGDTNGDGYADLLVGAGLGHAYLYLGGAAGLAGAQQPISFPGSGRVAGLGDVNGDGYDDLAFGTVYQSSSFSGPSPSGPTTMTSVPTGVGDLNGDGYADIAAGNPGFMDCLGQVSILLGSAPGLTSQQVPIILFGPDPDGEFGVSIATARSQTWRSAGSNPGRQTTVWVSAKEEGV